MSVLPPPELLELDFPEAALVLPDLADEEEFFAMVTGLMVKVL